MKSKPDLLAFSLIAGVVVVGVLGFVLGSASVAAESGGAQAAVGTAFTYQGWLNGSNGPVEDTCDFTFELWDAVSGGTRVGTVTRSGVSVSDGLFTVRLDFGPNAFTGDARWLATTVDCGAGAQALTPRQPLTATPYAGGLVPEATISGTANSNGILNLANTADDGLRVDAAGGDGVQVSSANYGFYVQNANVDGLLIDSAGNDGVYIGSAGSDGVYVASANYGLTVASSDTDGIFVNNADADGDGVGIAGYFDGDVRVTDHLTATNLYAVSKNFVIDHPQDPENKYLYHSTVESPDRMNVYNGNATLDANGAAWAQLPDYFEALNRDFRYQLTPIGGPAPDLYVAREVENNRFQIAGGEPGLKVSWQVTGIRDDAAARANPLQVEVEKPDGKKGLYLDPEAHGQPAAQSIHKAGRAGKGTDQTK